MTKSNILSKTWSSIIDVIFVIRSFLWPEWIETIDQLITKLIGSHNAHIDITMKRICQRESNNTSIDVSAFQIYQHYFITRVWFDDPRRRELTWSEYVGKGAAIFQNQNDNGVGKLIESEKESIAKIKDMAERIEKETGIKPTVIPLAYPFFDEMSN
ncbi:MAG: hypothetical protein PHG66_01460 [Candidatus Colwellbacteria bacterium]|nr:hypothetical protein [Candidatus Colwellbacteria bacterium]